jgi:anhydro-N-acetylmuramic acid kinase
MNSYTVIGVMSGTSMDGLDLACCTFAKEHSWSFNIDKAVTIPYPSSWRELLRKLPDFSAIEITQADMEYGRYIGQEITRFIEDNKLKPSLIASHGHTVFHQPSKGFTLQVGNGNAIAAETKLPVIFDFRALDVTKGGQGAPLVPAGDRYLFAEFDYCLNLGGFANISFEETGNRIAFDICPVNIVLNELVKILNLDYDKDGALAQSGKLIEPLLNKLEELDYYRRPYPKSLGREWVIEHILPILHNDSISMEDKLYTFTFHVACRISEVIDRNPGRVLVTGGGAYNAFLINLLKQKSYSELVLPDSILIEFKEALIFAFLGLLRFRNEINCLASVTGAESDSSTGIFVIP